MRDTVVDESNWFEHSHKIKRLGTVYSIKDSQVLQMQYENLDQMKKLWPEYSRELFDKGKENFSSYLNKSI